MAFGAFGFVLSGGLDTRDRYWAWVVLFYFDTNTFIFSFDSKRQECRTYEFPVESLTA
jgi:hypothetical protein